MKFFIETYGCQMNKADSMSVVESLVKQGHTPTENCEEADLFIMNTCSVRKTAENRIWGRIGFVKSLKEKKKREENSYLTLLIMGCMSERLGEEFFLNNDTVDLVVGNFFKDKIPEILDKYHPGERQAFVGEEDYSFYNSYPDRENRRKAFVTISHGCNNFCSYCIVPYLRGREKSRSSKEIITDINSLTEQGVWQITLLGQNVNSYGNDNNDLSFPELLELIVKETDIRWIKFLSSHPKDFTNELIEVMAAEERVSNWLHLAVQAGSDHILQEMNRNYRASEFIERVERLKALLPTVNLTTDIIVGYPGESDEDYLDTVRLMERVRFDDAYLYKYNVRENTVAAKSALDEVDEEVKSGRLSRIIELQREITAERKRSRLGSIFEVLPEKWSKNSSDQILGLTKEDLMIVFSGDESDFEKMHKVRAIEMAGNTIVGEKL